MEPSMDKMKDFFVPLPWRHLPPDMITCPSEMPKLILRISFRNFLIFSLSLIYWPDSKRSVSIEIAHWIRNMNDLKHSGHSRVFLFPLGDISLPPESPWINGIIKRYIIKSNLFDKSKNVIKLCRLKNQSITPPSLIFFLQSKILVRVTNLSWVDFFFLFLSDLVRIF